MAPALWRRGGGWRLIASAVPTVLALYVVYIGAGTLVFGSTDVYKAEEGLDTGSGIWLLAGLARIVALPDFAMRLYMAVVLLSLAGLGCWFAFVRRPDDPVAICGAAAILMAGLSFAISPHYPWYYAWLAVPCVVAPYRAVLWLASAPILLYLDTFGDRFVWPSVVFVPALLLVLVDLHRPRLVFRPELMKGSH